MQLGNATIDTWNLKITHSYLKSFTMTKGYLRSRLQKYMGSTQGRFVPGLKKMVSKTSAIHSKKIDQAPRTRLSHRQKLTGLLHLASQIRVGQLGTGVGNHQEHRERITLTGEATRQLMSRYIIGCIETLQKTMFANFVARPHEPSGRTKQANILESELTTTNYARSVILGTIKTNPSSKTVTGSSYTDTWKRVAIATW